MDDTAKRSAQSRTLARQVALVAFTWLSATLLMLLAAWALRTASIALSPGIGFWAILFLVIASSYALFYRFLWGSHRGPSILARVLVSGALAIATYLFVANASFMLGTLIFGA